MPTTPLTIAQESGAAWLSEFEPFTPTHAAVFACAVGAMAGASVLGRRWRAAGEPEKEWRFRLAWSVFIIAFQCFAIAWYAWPSRFDWAKSLPLHVCDLVVWLAPLALLTQWRPARTMLYFWGVGLSTQAFFTPVLTVGPGSPEFWVFWIGHTQIVGSAIYDAVALRYRPRVRDLLVAMGLSLVYLGLSVALNMATGWNYGYTGPTRPEAPTIIDKLGDWPLRLIPLTGLAFLAFIVAWAPWAIARMWSETGARETGDLSQCPRCAYDLAGLAVSQCPECGAFTGRSEAASSPPATSPPEGEVDERSESGEGS